jgi:NitT/TauT family transport system permease protein
MNNQEVSMTLRQIKLQPRQNEFKRPPLALGDAALRLAFVVLLLAIWQASHYLLVTRLDLWSGALFPAPLQVLTWLWQGFGLSYLTGNYRPLPGAALPSDFWQAMAQAEYPNAIAGTLARLSLGYGVALLVGVPLGVLVARFRLAERTIGWLAISLQGLPSICWIPLALLWFGRAGGNAPILFVTIMGSLFAATITVADGLRTVSPLLVRAGRTLGANPWRLAIEVMLPAALPSIVGGLKVAWGFAWRSLMAAELVSPQGGLGFLLNRDREFGDTDGVLASIVVTMMIGVLVQSLIFVPLERHIARKWGFDGQ